MGIASVAGIVDRALAFYGVGAERMRQSLLLHALASEALAKRVEVDPRKAYTGGILRSLGIMVLDRAARDRQPAVEVYDPAKAPTYLEWENVSFGLTHTEVMATVLDEWRFAPDLSLALQEHLLVREVGYDDRLACVLNLAGAIVARAGLALPGETELWKTTDRKFAATGLDAGQLAEVEKEVKGLFDRQRMALG